MIDHSFKYHPNKIAIVDRYGALQYHEFEQLIHNVKQQLKDRKITNQRIILNNNNSRFLLALFFAAIKLNNQIIFQDPNSTKTETAILANEYDVNCLISADQNGIVAIHFSGNNLNIKAAKVFYFSSGSTAIPKIFGYELDKLEDQFNVWIKYIGMTNTETVLCPLSMTHFHGSIISFTALMNGCTLLFLDDSKLNLARLSELMTAYRPTIITGVPNVYSKLLTELPANFKGFSNIKYAICGSAPLSVSIAKQLFEKFGIYLYQGYGLSEIGAIAMDLQPELGLGSVGKVIPEITYKIIDDLGQEVTKGTEGELIVKAPFMTDGYLKHKEATQSYFKDGWLFTKDIVYEDELSRIHILGRKSSFINIAGFKVQPLEIEKVITAFDTSIIVAVKEKIINKKVNIVAYMECQKAIDLSALKSFCKDNLAPYKVPHFELVNQLPKNTIGKIRYNQIN